MAGTVANGGLTVRFWGVRGSIACADPAMMRYGGNTSCVEVRCGDRLIILDAGTGLKPLGEALAAMGAATGAPVEADLLLSHTHLDHVTGLPFFRPAFDPGNRLRLWAGHLYPIRRLREVLAGLMAPPLFPVPLDIFRAIIAYEDFRAGEELPLGGGIAVRTAPLNHPNGATGYRIAYGGRSVCYITDTEHREGQRDPAILDLAAGADLMIYDSTYTDAEYPLYRGWGHSTWEEGVRLAEAAGVGQLAIFHHDPNHDDSFMDGVATAAAQARPGTIVAREGLELTL
ncbi:MBL fold metallo-hydrolase [Oceanibaculum nanhaiense]|uniref:MBL fold metallo-hydrolase n=1 Tax=Oceanibaculum nanhaiense TaxID=1909734 RepID=UPI003F6F2F88